MPDLKLYIFLTKEIQNVSKYCNPRKEGKGDSTRENKILIKSSVDFYFNFILFMQ